MNVIIYQASSELPNNNAASITSISSRTIALLIPAALTIFSTPPVKPQFILTNNEYIAGSNNKADNAAIINSTIITATNGFMAGIGIKKAHDIPAAVTVVASNKLIPVLAQAVFMAFKSPPSSLTLLAIWMENQLQRQPK